MMTQRQKSLLDFIKAYIAEHGYGPSFEEMRKATGTSSKSGIDRLVKALEKRGFISRIKYHARCVRIVERESEVERARREGYAAGCRDTLNEIMRPVRETEAPKFGGLQ